MLLALHSLLFQESSSIDANVSINGSDVISYGGNSVVAGASLVNAFGGSIVSDSNNITLSASANIIENGTAIGFYQGNVSVQTNGLVFAQYKISAYSKIEIENKFNKIENNLTFDIINKETIKLTLENK